MSDQPPSEQQQRPRRQGGDRDRNRNRGGNYNNQRRQDQGGERTHQTYRRNEEPKEYTPPRDIAEKEDRRPKTFGGGEYERVYRDKPEPKKPGTLGKKLLKFFSFGLLGGDKKPAAAPKPAPRHDSKAKGKGGRDRDRDRERDGKDRDRSRSAAPNQERRNNQKCRNGDRPEAQPRGERREPQPKRERETGPRQPRPAIAGPNPNGTPAPAGNGPSGNAGNAPRPPAPLNLESITAERLHVGNLSYDTVESDLFEAFNAFGKVINAEIVTHSRTQRSKGFGFAQMSSLEDARNAATNLHGKDFMGRLLIIGPAKGNKPERDRDREDQARDQESSDYTPAAEAPAAAAEVKSQAE